MGVFVLGNPSSPFSEEDKKLNGELMSRWANFARTGNPNSEEEGTNEWLPVSSSGSDPSDHTVAADPPYMRFTGEGGAMVESNREKMEQCAAIFRLGPTFNHSSNRKNEAEPGSSSSSGGDIPTSLNRSSNMQNEEPGTSSSGGV